MSSGLFGNGCVYFWGAAPQKYPAGCKHFVFSQWHMCEFVDPDNGNNFTSAEQYMMAGKASLFNDHATLQKILECHDPRKVKALGRRVVDFDDEVWKAHRYEIVRKGNELKFGQNEDLREALLSTGDLDIAEASPVDRIWGIGLNPQKAAETTSPSQWKGQNLLGKALIEVRQKLRDETEVPETGDDATEAQTGEM
ncbi:hypothetical protein BSKO_06306 [Bryopsis sp. KO-2023]|nr:hypothetical protein BSKO_06306 [Bryopsis sp. KO-2023]